MRWTDVALDGSGDLFVLNIWAFGPDNEVHLRRVDPRTGAVAPILGLAKASGSRTSTGMAVHSGAAAASCGSASGVFQRPNRSASTACSSSMRVLYRDARGVRCRGCRFGGLTPQPPGALRVGAPRAVTAAMAAVVRRWRSSPDAHWHRVVYAVRAQVFSAFAPPDPPSAGVRWARGAPNGTHCGSSSAS